ncbi:MAG: molybdate ABC transporter substrate-binding protein [Nitriliruptorales bacterium]|nr:molybdate ABC transporter substrate-binding protein [Nitriliruptorales bacterium]
MIRAASLLVLLCVLVGSCSQPEDRKLTVFAAASLVDAMDDLEATFESSHPGVDLVISTAGSQQLAAQIRDGAPADVFVSADLRQLDAVGDQLAGEPRVVATNQLVIAVAPGNPSAIGGLSDLAARDLVLVLPAPDVPAGAYARRALLSAGVEVTPDDLTPDVRGALSKVALGEADAAIVYRTDVAARADEVDAIPIDAEVAVEYHGAALERSPHPELAGELLDFLTDPETGGAILADHGFSSP